MTAGNDAPPSAPQPKPLDPPAQDASAHDDPAFVEAWRAMEAKGYLYSEGNIEKVHLGWQMGVAAMARHAKKPE